MSAHVDFCGEIYPVTADRPLVIGRSGELIVDDNPYLHRRFLQVGETDSIYWLANIGTSLSATVADGDGLLQAWLAPGARLPLVFARTSVWFTAGPTTYEFEIVIDDSAFSPAWQEPPEVGTTTVGRVSLRPDQRLLVLALAEDVLRRGNRGVGAIPSSADAAARLNWATTKFNRKLDRICEKLANAGVRGLHGGPGRLAVSRRARLVEYALAVRLVTSVDLPLLDELTAARHGRADGTETDGRSP